MEGTGEGYSHGGSAMSSSMPYEIPPIVSDSSYFTHAEDSSLIMAHIVLMTICWVFILPISMGKVHRSGKFRY